MLTKEKQKKKIGKTAIILIAVFVVISLLTVCGIFAIKKANADASGDFALIKEKVSESSLIEYGEKYVTANLNQFESLDSALNSVSAFVKDAKIEVKDDKDGTYSVFVDGIDAFDMTVNETLTGRKAEFTSYKLGKTYYVEAPHGAVITSNGNVLTGGADCPYFFLSEYETGKKAEIRSDRYCIGNFFGIPSCTGNMDGYELISPFTTDDTLYFSYPVSATKEIILTVPVGTSLIVNGIRVSDDSSCELVKYPFLSRFEENLDECLTSYEIDLGRFFIEPEIEAYYNGKLLTPSEENGYIYPLPEGNTLSKYTITAPTDSIVKINGVTLGASDMIVAKKNYDLFTYEYTTENEDGTVTKTNMTEKYEFDYLPTQTVYEVTGLYFEPEITCYSETGEEYSVYDYLSTKYNIVFKANSKSTIPSKDIVTIKYYSKYFARYVCEASTTSPAYYNGLRATALRGSPAYSRIQAMWHKRSFECKISSFGTITYENFTDHGNKFYSVTAVIPYNSKSNGTTLQHEMRVEMLYTFSGSTRYIVNFNVLTEVLE